MFWKRQQRTTGPEHAAALSRTSDDWAAEIARLRAELDQLAVQRAALTAEAGRAMLDGQAARTADLQGQLAALDARERVTASAIEAAEARRHDAERDEDRKRLTVQLREYYGMVAAYCAASSVVKQAEDALSAAVQARRDTVRGDRLGVLYDTLIGAGLMPAAITDIREQCPTAEAFIATSERYRHLAASAGLDDAGAVQETGEAIDRATLPLTAKEREVDRGRAAEQAREGVTV